MLNDDGMVSGEMDGVCNLHTYQVSFKTGQNNQCRKFSIGYNLIIQCRRLEGVLATIKIGGIYIDRSYNRCKILILTNVKCISCMH